MTNDNLFRHEQSELLICAIWNFDLNVNIILKNLRWFLLNRSGKAFGDFSLFSAALFWYYSPTFQTVLFMSSIALFWWLWPHFLRLKLSPGAIIAANIGQPMVNLKLWLSKSSSSHRQLHGGRGLISQSLACESHTLPLGYHATI